MVGQTFVRFSRKQSILENAIGQMRKAASAHDGSPPGQELKRMTERLISMRDPAVVAELKRRQAKREQPRRVAS